MGKAVAVVASIKNVLKAYPAISAALINFGVFAAGYFGLHITASQLVAAVGALDVLFGVIVHSNVTPVSKVVASQLVPTSGRYNENTTFVAPDQPEQERRDMHG